MTARNTDRAVRTLRRAVRGRRLSRHQAAVLDQLLSIVANRTPASWRSPPGEVGGDERHPVSPAGGPVPPAPARSARHLSRHLLAASRRRLAVLVATLVATWRAVAGGPGHPVPPGGRTSPDCDDRTGADLQPPTPPTPSQSLPPGGWRGLVAGWRTRVGGLVPPGGPDRSAHRGWRSAWRRLVTARQLARLVADAWPVVVRGYLPDLASQVPVCRERQPGHPAWCSQGYSCHGPKRASDGTIEWDHASRVDVYGEHGAADVFLVRLDSLLPPNGRHASEDAPILTANGTFTVEEAEAFALAILHAVRQLDAGLPGTPGGIPAVRAALPESWPPPGRNRAL